MTKKNLSTVRTCLCGLLWFVK